MSAGRCRQSLPLAVRGEMHAWNHQLGAEQELVAGQAADDGRVPVAAAEINRRCDRGSGHRAVDRPGRGR